MAVRDAVIKENPVKCGFLQIDRPQGKLFATNKPAFGTILATEEALA